MRGREGDAGDHSQGRDGDKAEVAGECKYVAGKETQVTIAKTRRYRRCRVGRWREVKVAVGDETMGRQRG